MPRVDIFKEMCKIDSFLFFGYVCLFIHSPRLVPAYSPEVLKKVQFLSILRSEGIETFVLLEINASGPAFSDEPDSTKQDEILWKPMLEYS